MKTNNNHFEYFEHQADVGIIGFGKTLDHAFEEGAKAMFQVMAEIANIEPKKEIRITVEAYDQETLFVEWLNALSTHKDIEDMLFCEFVVEMKQHKNKWILNGIAKGEKIDYDKHRLKLEVKAATYSQLKIDKSQNLYRVRCVLDV